MIDGRKGIFSCWLRLNGGDNTLQRILMGFTGTSESGFLWEQEKTRFRVQRSAINLIEVIPNYEASLPTFLLQSSSSFVASPTWLHILASWDATDTVEVARLYVNDVLEASDLVHEDADVDYSWDYVSIGSTPLNGDNKLNGDLAYLYLNTVEYLDFSVTANRRKFISASGGKVDLGADGSTPTGTQPSIYLKHTSGGSPTDFATNLGAEGNFTLNGTLVEGPPVP